MSCFRLEWNVKKAYYNEKPNNHRYCNQFASYMKFETYEGLNNCKLQNFYFASQSHESPLLCKFIKVSLTFLLYNFIDMKLVNGKL